MSRECLRIMVVLLRADLKHCPATKTTAPGTTLRCCAVKIADLIENQSGRRLSSVRAAHKPMKNTKIPSTSHLNGRPQPEHDPVIRVSGARVRGAIEIAALTEDEH